MLYLDDLRGHSAAMEQSLTGQNELLGRLYAAYLTRIAMELTDGSNRTNVTVKRVPLSPSENTVVPELTLIPVLVYRLCLHFPSHDPAWKHVGGEHPRPF